MGNATQKWAEIVCVAEWGEAGAIWLPSKLRELWADDPLPSWLSDLAALPIGSTIGDLTVFPEANARDRERIANFAAYLARNRQPELDSLKVFGREIPTSVRLEKLPFRVRTRNRLHSENLLLDHSALETLSFGDLLRIPGLGAVSMLDFACTTEGAMRQLELMGPQTAVEIELEKKRLDTAINALRDAAAQSWTEKVSERDPRFRDFLPAGRGMLFDRLDTALLNGNPSEIFAIARSLPGLCDKLHEIRELRLEEALSDFLKATSKLEGARLSALLDRFGWAGRPPATLQEAGRKIRVTRERLRQLEARTKSNIPTHPVVMPAVEKAIAALEAAAPLPVDQASELLREQGISTGPFHPKSVISAATVCDVPHALRLAKIRGTPMVLAKWEQGLAKKLATYAIRQCGASGATNTLEVVEQARSEGLNISEEKGTQLLKNISTFEFLSDSWFWYPQAPVARNRLRNVCRKMLSVARAIPIPKLREGVRREYTFRTSSWQNRWQLRVPPQEVLRRFLLAHPEFSVDELGRAQANAILDYSTELGEADRVIIDALRATPTGVLDRQSIRDACLPKGINSNTLEIKLTYSAVVEHLDINIWGIRGIEVPPAAVEALRQANSLKPRERRVHGFGWTPEGRVWVAARLQGHTTNLVFGIPGGVKRYLSGKQFAAIADDGGSEGTIGVTEDGTAYGFNRFLARSGADADDFLVIEFDIADSSAVVRLGGDELLAAMEG
jgi:hypothetical protein